MPCLSQITEASSRSCTGLVLTAQENPAGTSSQAKNGPTRAFSMEVVCCLLQSSLKSLVVLYELNIPYRSAMKILMFISTVSWSQMYTTRGLFQAVKPENRLDE